ncbi:hypothetical protein HPB47_014209 [Ixodes persulcatus]|uniref:Uncharacterized protein n=1 Tax=Ixodes persulcatus TaxID=34615 RepID=A0AC60QWI2_IXOPE|nr:hypothetical protein HPB47_014209 [Ixodes persulcatus]
MPVARIDRRFSKMKERLFKELERAKYVAISADCWKTFNRGFFGVTCLWLDAESLERQSAALCCHRIKGSVTYEKIAEELENVFLEYRIENKVARVVTDSGSNFLKAFSVYMFHAGASPFLSAHAPHGSVGLQGLSDTTVFKMVW